MSFLNTQLAKKTCHHKNYESAKIIKNMSFSNMQLIKNMLSQSLS